MAQNIIDISLLNPIKFIQRNRVQHQDYKTRFFDENHFVDTIRDFEEHTDYYQLWQSSDTIYLHILSNYAPHAVELWTLDGQQYSTQAMTYVPSSIEISGVKVYEADLNLATVPAGDYRLRLFSGLGVEDLESEKICVAATHPNTLLFQYRHNENDFDIAFETFPTIKYLEFRVQGIIRDTEPFTDRVAFVDQPRNLTQLSAKTYYQQKLVIGDAGGVPEWVPLWINEIFRCSEVLLDGRQYVIPEGATWEPNREENYPMAGWMIDIRPAEIRSSKRFVALGNPGGGTTVLYNLHSKGFGPQTGPASSNQIQIQNLE